MFYDDRVLREISGIFDFPNFEDVYENVVAAIQEVCSIISHQYVGSSLASEPISIGSFVSHTNSNQTCTLDFLVTSSNLTLIDNDLQYTQTKSKRQKEDINTTEKIKKAIMHLLVGYFTSATKFFILPNSLFIESVYELGFNINIFVGVEKNDIVHMLDATNNRIAKFNYKRYYEQIEKKNDETLGQFKRVVNMFVNLLVNCECQMNTYAIESLFYNVPNELYVGSYSDQIIKIVNYLNIVDFRNFTCVDCNEKIVDNAFINTNYYTYKTNLGKVVESLR